MAEISAGVVNVAGGRYEVVLRPVGGNANRQANARNNANQEENSGVQGTNEVPSRGGAKKQKGGKKTRKLSGYMKFAQNVRPEIIKENPALKSDIPGIGRKIGEMWRGLSAEEKAKY